MILIGEMRDNETIATALTVAETGHLVFATLTPRTHPRHVDRVIDVFPSGQQDQIQDPARRIARKRSSPNSSC